MKELTKKLFPCLLCLLLATLPAAHADGAQAVTVKLQIGKKNVTKKTISMETGTRKTLKIFSSEAVTSVTYNSSDTAIATITKKGIIRAVKPGTARITVSVKTRQRTRSVWMKVKVSESRQTEGNQMKITVGNTVFTATLADNSSARALKELLAKGPLTIEMSDYGSMEKVGPIGTTLPRNDTEITTEPGDIILYQGNSLTIYYDTNTWNFTRIGKIDGVTKAELLEVLGDGDVTVTFSLD